MADTETGLTRRDREREQHRSDILAAAELVFVRDGFATKVETVAKEAEYSVGSIYNFFPSKDDLFKNVLLRVSQLRFKDIERALPELCADPWAGLRTVCHIWLEHHVQHGDFLNVARSQHFNKKGGLLPPDDPIGRQVFANGDHYRTLMLEFFSALAATTAARKIEPEIMFTAFEGYIRTSLFVAFHRGHGKIDQRQLEDDVYRAVCKLFKNEVVES